MSRAPARRYAELDDRDAPRRERRGAEARFPCLKHLAEFDLGAAPSINPATVAALETGAWIDAGEPVVLLGDSRTGKSHLLIGLGLAACEQGRRVRYVTTAGLVNELAEAVDERTLSRVTPPTPTLPADHVGGSVPTLLWSARRWRRSQE